MFIYSIFFIGLKNSTIFYAGKMVAMVAMVAMVEMVAMVVMVV